MDRYVHKRICMCMNLAVSYWIKTRGDEGVVKEEKKKRSGGRACNGIISPQKRRESSGLKGISVFLSFFSFSFSF